MSDSDEFVSFSETEDSRDVLEDSDADELVEPYQDEPLAHSSDEEELCLQFYGQDLKVTAVWKNGRNLFDN